MNYLVAIFLSISILFSPLISIADDIDDAETADLELKLQKNAISDPFEKLNRKVFTFNHGLDVVIITPLAKTYEKAIPQFGRDRVHSFLQNLHEPINFLNGILQLKPQKAFTALSRLTINSLWGIGGLNDVAAAAGVPYEANGFDNTLKHYGLSTGPYLVLPVLGSSSGRGIFGTAADIFSDPFNIWVERKVVIVRSGVELIDTRSNLFSVTEFIDKTSTDKYAAYRSLYFQRVNKNETTH